MGFCIKIFVISLVGWVEVTKPNASGGFVGLAKRNPTYGRLKVSRVLSVNQGKDNCCRGHFVVEINYYQIGA